jgi:hypothetical protein
MEQKGGFKGEREMLGEGQRRSGTKQGTWGWGLSNWGFWKMSGFNFGRFGFFGFMVFIFLNFHFLKI